MNCKIKSIQVSDTCDQEVETTSFVKKQLRNKEKRGFNVIPILGGSGDKFSALRLKFNKKKRENG